MIVLINPQRRAVKFYAFSRKANNFLVWAPLLVLCAAACVLMRKIATKRCNGLMACGKLQITLVHLFDFAGCGAHGATAMQH